MGMAYMGLTHCEKCYKPLKDNEYVLCKKCEEEREKGKDESRKMIYKGYELMKAVSEGKLNLKQKVSTTSLDYKNCTIEFILKDIAFNIMDLDFELIEDEIDIDSIIELEEFELDQFVTMDKNERFDRTMIEYSKINQLVQAVKQLNKEVKELENKIN